MYHLVLKPRAIKMAKNGYDWYEAKQNGLGETFFNELESCYNKIETWPAAYTIIKKDFRHIVLKTFPYVAVFKIIKEDIVVYAVFHTSQNPQKKFKRY